MNRSHFIISEQNYKRCSISFTTAHNAKTESAICCMLAERLLLRKNLVRKAVILLFLAGEGVRGELVSRTGIFPLGGREEPGVDIPGNTIQSFGIGGRIRLHHPPT